MAVFDCLPTIIDDTKQARYHEDIARVVYDVVSGRGRARGSEHGLARTGTWRTVMLTSGEAPIVDFTENGGVRARVLEFWDSPFGNVTEHTAEVVVNVGELFLENFGHAGPRFVNFLIRNRQRWQDWRERYSQIRHVYQQRAGRNAVAIRMATGFAALEMAAELAHESLGLPWQYDGTISTLWDAVTAESQDADRAAAALLHLLSWCFSRELDFEGRGGSDRHVREVVGRWNFHRRDAPQESMMAIYPHHVNAVLEQAGFEPAAVKRMWRDRGWTVTSPNKLTTKVRVSDGPSSSTREMIAIRWSVIDGMMGEDGAEESGTP